jgi:hypothetical protein
MPAKSRRKRGKNLPTSKRIPAGRGITSATTAQSETKETEPVMAQTKPVVTGKESAAPVQTTAARYPFIKSELTTIGILAIAMLAILIILSFVIK